MRYTTGDLAELFGVEETTLRAMARDGLLPGEERSGRWLFGEEAVEALETLAQEDDEAEEEDVDGDEEEESCEGDDEDI